MNLERGFLFANKLLLVGWDSTIKAIAEIRLADRTGHAVSIRGIEPCLFKRKIQGKGRADAGATLGVLIPIDIADLLPLQVDGSAWSADIRFESGEEQRQAEVPIHAVDLREEIGPNAARPYLEVAVRAGLYPAVIGRLIDKKTVWQGDASGLAHSVDHQLASQSGQFLLGWIANLGNRRMALVSGDFIAAATDAEFVSFSRADVTAHLKNHNVAVTTDIHGFYVSFPKTLPSNDQLYMVEETEGGAVVHGPIALTSSRNDELAFSAIRTMGRGGRWPAPAVAERLLRPFLLQSRVREQAFSVDVLHPGPGAPRAAIIVPFYKEWRFIRSILAMQLTLPAEYEWILVCDDASIAGEIEGYLWSRRTALRHRTLFVRNDGNYGFSAANNIGVRNASAPAVILMNSDIWVEDAAPLSRAVDAVLKNEYDIVGCRLLFEDGTIQHDGMAFERSTALGDLLIATHPRKGLPAPPADAAIEPALAVTGALMVMSREGYARWGGFSEEFIRGDFEDADLCLRVAAGGGRIGIVRTNAVYHLERQSISRMGAENLRAAITYLNCIQFNRRWESALTAPGEAAANGAAQPAATGTASRPAKARRAAR